MAARAMWKGVVTFFDVRVPVKLYSALNDRDVHFRLLHRKDRVPVKQTYLDPLTEEVVPYEKVGRAYATDEGQLVLLREEELHALEPKEDRNIHVLNFVPASTIDHRWYRRPYYLGPDDGAGADYAALASALAAEKVEGLASWTMRKKEYVGALRLHEGYPMLISLRYAEEVVSLGDIEAPAGPVLDKRELSMAEQLVDMLAADFEPEEYADEYRERVVALIETKSRGGSISKYRPREAASTDDLAAALEASLKERRRA